MANHCTHCSADLEPGAVVCVHCGSLVNESVGSGPLAAQVSAPQEPLAFAEPPVPQPVDSTPAYVMDNDLTGIGGWLILVAIGLAIGPFVRMFAIVVDSRLLFSGQVQEAFHPKPGLEAIVFYELVTNTFFLVYILLLNFLFYRKRRSFPLFMIFNLAAQFVAILVDHLWASRFGHSSQVFPVLQSLVVAVIWIPYMLNSIRVEQTFVN